jgi:broad specificity phosphatase PhoE
VRAALDGAAAGAGATLVVTHAGVIKAALASLNHPGAWRAETAFGDWRRVDWA